MLEEVFRSFILSKIPVTISLCKDTSLKMLKSKKVSAAKCTQKISKEKVLNAEMSPVRVTNTIRLLLSMNYVFKCGYFNYFKRYLFYI